ncbi:MAG: hypothetical protein MJK13_04410 [Pseudomonadales bacterium]|nr:hypothetical protein [Pseudomonadales bacterium]
MYSGRCHCGAITFETTELPQWLTECNCSICHRLGSLWAHVQIETVTFNDNQKPDAALTSIRYVQGDKSLAVHSCKNCGCTTHWENLHPDKSSVMALNFRMCERADIKDIRIRKFDGADTWSYID